MRGWLGSIISNKCLLKDIIVQCMSLGSTYNFETPVPNNLLHDFCWLVARSCMYFLTKVIQISRIDGNGFLGIINCSL